MAKKNDTTREFALTHKRKRKLAKELGDDPAAWNCYLQSIGLGVNDKKHHKGCHCSGCRARRKSGTLR